MTTNNFNLPDPYAVVPNAVSTPMFTPQPVVVQQPALTGTTTLSASPSASNGYYSGATADPNQSFIDASNADAYKIELAQNAPETLKSPIRSQFVNDTSYNTAVNKFQTNGNWATKEVFPTPGSSASIPTQYQTANPYDSPLAFGPNVPVPGSANAAAVQAGMYQSGLTPEQLALQSQLRADQQTTATQVLDPNQEYQNQLKNYQAQIDSINSMYADRLNQARIQGQGRIESRQFAQGRSGQIGSGVGEAGVNAVQNANTDIENSIRAEQSAAIQDVYAKVRSGAETSLAAKTLAKQEGADKLLEYLNNVPGKKKEAVSSAVAELIARGVTEMTVEEQKSFSDGLGVSFKSIEAEWERQNKLLAEDMAKKEQDSQKANLENQKTKAEISNLINKNDFEAAQKALDRQLEQKKIDIQWHNAQSSRISALKKDSTATENKTTVETNINKNIAAAQADGQWDNWSEDERSRFIRAMGGLPSDYEI